MDTEKETRLRDLAHKNADTLKSWLDDHTNFDVSWVRQRVAFLESSISDLQNHVMKCVGYLDSNEMQKQLEDLTVLERAKEELARHEPPGKASTSPKAEVTSSLLPDLEVPTFDDGNVYDWSNFWGLFCSVIHNRDDISEATKFCYLRQYLTGTAEMMISEIPLTSDGYRQACERLQEEYDRNDLFEAAYFDELLDLEGPTSTGNRSLDYQTLQKFKATISSKVACLELLGILPGEYQIMLLHHLTRLLPVDLRLKWQEKEDMRSVKAFLAFLNVTLLQNWPNIWSSAESLNGHPEKCGFCKKGHVSENCFKFLKLSQTERVENVKIACLCFKCLKPNHSFKQCPVRCNKCNDRHHETLCRN